jgi:hypothetical protein
MQIGEVNQSALVPAGSEPHPFTISASCFGAAGSSFRYAVHRDGCRRLTPMSGDPPFRSTNLRASPNARLPIVPIVSVAAACFNSTALTRAAVASQSGWSRAAAAPGDVLMARFPE